MSNAKAVNVAYNVIGATVKPNGKNRYYISVQLTAENREYNPKGRFGFTYAQLGGIANNAGIDNPETLLKALNRGGCTMMTTLTLRTPGESWETVREGVVVAKGKYGQMADGTIDPNAQPWWDLDNINTNFLLSDSAQALVDKLDEAILLNIGMADVHEVRDGHASRRAAQMSRFAQASGALPIGGRTIVDKTDDDDDDDANAAKAANATKELEKVTGGNKRTGN